MKEFKKAFTKILAECKNLSERMGEMENSEWLATRVRISELKEILACGEREEIIQMARSL